MRPTSLNPLPLALVLLAGCPSTEADKDTDTDVADTDVADTDVADTDVADTDVADTDETDVPLPCAFEGTHTRVVLDPSTAEATYYAPRRVLGGPVSYTQWRALDDTDGTLAVTDGQTSALIVQFDPPMVLQRVPALSGYQVRVGSDPAVFLGGGPVTEPLNVTVTAEGTLPNTDLSGTITGTELFLNWSWDQLEADPVQPMVGDTLSCVRFEIAATQTSTFDFGRAEFRFNESGNTASDANPLVAPAP